MISSSSSLAATVAPSVRIVPATAVARARVSGARAVLSAADRDSTVGVGPSCAAPMPRSATRPAQYGWSAICGHHHLGRAGPGGRRRRARAAVVHDGGHPGEQRLVVDLADGEAVVPVVDQGQVGPAAGDERRGGPARGSPRWPPGRRPPGARTLPKPTYTGGVPASRNAASSAGSGRSSGRIHAPVCTTSRSGDPGHGPRIGSAASHGRSVKTWSRTLSTGGRPIAARWVLSGVAEQRVHALGVQVPQHPVVGHVRRERPARPRQRRVVRRRQDDRAGRSRTRSGCPASRPPTAHGLAGIRPVATTASQPSAAAATRVELRRRPARPRAGAASAADGGFAAVQHRAHRRADRHQRHADPRQPAPRSPAARTPAPPRRAPATAPRVPPAVRRPRATPYVDNNTRISLPPFPQFWLRPAILRHDPGLAASPPVRYMLKVEGVTTPGPKSG